MTEILHNIKGIKLGNLVDMFLTQLNQSDDEMRNNQNRYMWVNLLSHVAFSIFPQMLPIVGLTMLSYHGFEISLAESVTATTVLTNFSYQFSGLPNIGHQYTYIKESMARVEGFLRCQEVNTGLISR